VDRSVDADRLRWERTEAPAAGAGLAHAAFTLAPIAMALLDDRATIQYANRAFSHLTGREDVSLIGMPVTALVVPAHRVLVRAATSKVSEGRPLGEPPIVRLYPDTADRWAELHLAILPAFHDGRSAAGFILQLVDVTEHRLQERRLRDMAYRDPVTQVLSRRGIEHAISTFCQRTERSDRPGALLAIDLDRFKSVNDTLGHPVGDVVLSRVAADMRRRLRPRDLIGRLGGDEFVVLLPSCNAADAQKVAHDLLGAIAGNLAGARRVSHRGSDHAAAVKELVPTVGAGSGSEAVFEEGADVFVTASIGIALFEPHITPEEIIDAADRALYAAKRNGGNCWSMAPGARDEAPFSNGSAPAEQPFDQISELVSEGLAGG
jgi:diguanylate cyclase (GGDEF)-like protein/PAS domain S-box-containing protein